MVEVLPSILSADFARLGEEVAAAEQGGAKTIHVDVMDGHFVPNLSLGFPVIASLRKATKLKFDCHLMIENPDAFIADFAEAGANWVIVHYEACRHLHRTLGDPGGPPGRHSAHGASRTGDERQSGLRRAEVYSLCSRQNP
jgi:ribulose-phosphate 3-epimerase